MDPMNDKPQTGTEKQADASSPFPAREQYKIQLDVFEGPLDLLLYLIKKEELDIYDIPIERVTRQYMRYLDLMRMLDLNIAGEFIVMAATLMMVKSRMLLPVDERADLEEEDEEDPRWDLIKQLVEYKKFKDAADHLQHLELSRENVFGREGQDLQWGVDTGTTLKDVGIFDLISAFNEALSKIPKEELTEIFGDRFTVADKVDSLLAQFKESSKLSFLGILKTMHSRQEMICTFLAILELMKLNKVIAMQDVQFGEMVLVSTDEAPA